MREQRPRAVEVQLQNQLDAALEISANLQRLIEKERRRTTEAEARAKRAEVQLKIIVAEHWMDVGPRNNDCCAFCGATITPEVQAAADGEGWGHIEHVSDCVVVELGLTKP